MIGALIGDIVGSRFEWDNCRRKDFDLLPDACFFTDDSIMTLAVAKALLDCQPDASDLEAQTIRQMQTLGREYPDGGYGGMFSRWLCAADPKPYGSYGNGSAMRVSACGYAGETLDQVKALSRTVTAVTHNHPEGIKGAEATAVGVWMARQGASMTELRDYLTAHYYPIPFTLDQIRETYQFNETCQETVPQALEAFFESVSFEDAIRNAISIGGDSDTLAAITGAVAEAYYGVSPALRQQPCPSWMPVCEKSSWTLRRNIPPGLPGTPRRKKTHFSATAMPEDFFPYGETELRHLRSRDRRLGEIMERLGPLRRRMDRDLYSAFLHQILAQQISNKALATVWGRLEEAFGKPSPQALGSVSPQALQALGMSRQKAETIQRVTAKVLSGEWDLDHLGQWSDQEAIARFTSVKGIGVWTAEMVLLFGLRRPDILSFRDLGIQRGMRMVYGHPVLTPALFQRHRERLSPYGSVASLYFWAVAAGALPDLHDPAPTAPL